jgi:hypothetical protein
LLQQDRRWSAGPNHPRTTPAASPISYAVDGKQYVAIAAGNTIYSFALP